jgi:chaperonin cofactor prefoldin
MLAISTDLLTTTWREIHTQAHISTAYPQGKLTLSYAYSIHPPSPRPSIRLLRAAAAERVELEKHRDRILRERDSLRTELERIEGTLAEVEDRRRLLDQLAPIEPATTSDPTEQQDHGSPVPAQQLRGPAIRETAVGLLAESPQTDVIHYRQWFELLRSTGYEVVGKDPLAVFLTQVSRSPAVRKSTQAGIYEIDRQAPQRLRARLDRLHADMRELTDRHSSKTDLSEIRAHRSQLTSEISQTEKALEEVTRLLDPKVDQPALPAA